MGCYEDEKDRYKDIDLDKMQDGFFDEPEEFENDEQFKGDFEDEGEDLSPEELQKLQLADDKFIEEYLAAAEAKNKKQCKPKNTKKKQNKNNEDEESWETLEEV